MGRRLIRAYREAATGGMASGLLVCQEQQQGASPGVHAGGSGKLESEPLQGTGNSQFASPKEDLNWRAEIATPSAGKARQQAG